MWMNTENTPFYRLLWILADFENVFQGLKLVAVTHIGESMRVSVEARGREAKTTQTEQQLVDMNECENWVKNKSLVYFEAKEP